MWAEIGLNKRSLHEAISSKALALSRKGNYLQASRKVAAPYFSGALVQGLKGLEVQNIGLTFCQPLPSCQLLPSFCISYIGSPQLYSGKRPSVKYLTAEIPWQVYFFPYFLSSREEGGFLYFDSSFPSEIGAHVPLELMS